MPWIIRAARVSDADLCEQFELASRIR
jgi:hypothetical protein